jgi:hypothetical protein
LDGEVFWPRPAELLAYGLHLGFEGKEAAHFVRPDAPGPPATINDWKTEAMEKGLLEPPSLPEGILAPEVELTNREKCPYGQKTHAAR